jgi:hypothetical protein
MASLNNIAGILISSGFLTLRDLAVLTACSFRSAQVAVQCITSEPSVLHRMVASQPRMLSQLLSISMTAGLSLPASRELNPTESSSDWLSPPGARLCSLAMLGDAVPHAESRLLSSMEGNSLAESSKQFKRLMIRAETVGEVANTWPAWLRAAGSAVDRAGTLVLAALDQGSASDGVLASWERKAVQLARDVLPASAKGRPHCLVPSLPALVGLCCCMKPENGAVHPSPLAAAAAGTDIAEADFELATDSLLLFARLVGSDSLVSGGQLVALHQARALMPVSDFLSPAGMASVAASLDSAARLSTPSAWSAIVVASHSQPACSPGSASPWSSSASSPKAAGGDVEISTSLAVAMAARCQSSLFRQAPHERAASVTEQQACDAFAILCTTHLPLAARHWAELGIWPLPRVWLQGVLRSLGAGAVHCAPGAREYAAVLAVTDGWAGILFWVISALAVRQEAVLLAETSTSALSALLSAKEHKHRFRVTRHTLMQAAESKCFTLNDAASAILRARNGSAPGASAMPRHAGRDVVMAALAKAQTLFTARSSQAAKQATQASTATRRASNPGGHEKATRHRAADIEAPALLLAAASLSPPRGSFARSFVSQPDSPPSVQIALHLRQPRHEEDVARAAKPAVEGPDVDERAMDLQLRLEAISNLQEWSTLPDSLPGSLQLPSPQPTLSHHQPSSAPPPPTGPPPQAYCSTLTPRTPSPDPSPDQDGPGSPALLTSFHRMEHGLQSPAAMSLAPIVQLSSPARRRVPRYEAVGAARAAAACLKAGQPLAAATDQLHAWNASSPARQALDAHELGEPLNPLSPLRPLFPPNSPAGSAKRRLIRSPQRKPPRKSDHVPEPDTAGFAPDMESLPNKLTFDTEPVVPPLPSETLRSVPPEPASAQLQEARDTNAHRASLIARSLVAAGAGSFVHVVVVGSGQAAGSACVSAEPHPAPFAICSHEYEALLRLPRAPREERGAAGAPSDPHAPLGAETFRHLATGWLYQVGSRAYIPPVGVGVAESYVCRLVEVPSQFGTVQGAVYRAATQ